MPCVSVVVCLLDIVNCRYIPIYLYIYLSLDSTCKIKTITRVDDGGCCCERYGGLGVQVGVLLVAMVMVEMTAVLVCVCSSVAIVVVVLSANPITTGLVERE